MSEPFSISSDASQTVAVINVLCKIGQEGRGRDCDFQRLWKSTPRTELSSSLPVYCVEYSSPEEGFKVAVVGHLFKYFQLVGRRTHVVLCTVKTRQGFGRVQGSKSCGVKDFCH